MGISKNSTTQKNAKGPRHPRPHLPRPRQHGPQAFQNFCRLDLKAKLPISDLRWPRTRHVTSRFRHDQEIAQALKDSEGRLTKERVHAQLLKLVDTACEDRRRRHNNIGANPETLSMHVLRWCFQTDWTRAIYGRSNVALVSFFMSLMEARVNGRKNPRHEIEKERRFETPLVKKIDEFHKLVSLYEWGGWFEYANEDEKKGQVSGEQKHVGGGGDVEMEDDSNGLIDGLASDLNKMDV